jgi:hypothetical protein
MFNYEPYPEPVIEPSNSSYGRWFIRLDDVTFRFFWYKSEAKAFLVNYMESLHESI